MKINTKECIIKLYTEGKSQKEIGTILSVTRQMVNVCLIGTDVYERCREGRLRKEKRRADVIHQMSDILNVDLVQAELMYDNGLKIHQVKALAKVDKISCAIEKNPVKNIRALSKVLFMQESTIIGIAKHHAPDLLRTLSKHPTREQRRERRVITLKAFQDNPRITKRELADKLNIKLPTLLTWLVANPEYNLFKE